MKVYVKLWGLLREHHPGPNRSIALEVVLPAGATPADLGPALNLPAKLVRNIFINNAAARLDTALNDGDQVSVFPPVVGG
jgi:molybdopterin converting factor small subunit